MAIYFKKSLSFSLHVIMTIWKIAWIAAFNALAVYVKVNAAVNSSVDYFEKLWKFKNQQKKNTCKKKKNMKIDFIIIYFLHLLLNNLVFLSI